MLGEAGSLVQILNHDGKHAANYRVHHARNPEGPSTRHLRLLVSKTHTLNDVSGLAVSKPRISPQKSTHGSLLARALTDSHVKGMGGTAASDEGPELTITL